MMTPTDSLPSEAFWQEDPYDFIKPEEFEALGIDAADIPPGTYPAHNHPSQLPSRFGGNAYGFGFYEVSERLSPKDVELLQTVSAEDPEQLGRSHKEINRIYKEIGLLIRFSSSGIPYYLIPVQLVSSSLSLIKNKADAIGNVIRYHRKKYLKESQKIGLVTHGDDLVVKDLSIRFREHQFIVLDSFETLQSLHMTLDLVIVTRDIYETLRMEKLITSSKKKATKKRLDDFAFYFIWKIYNLLKTDGEIFVIGHQYPQKTGQTVQVTFHDDQELKNFVLFSHIFKTRKRYQAKGSSLIVNVTDFQCYLNAPYVEKEVVDHLLGDGDLQSVPLEKMNHLPYLNYPIETDFAYDQEKVWSKLLSTCFDQIFLKGLLPPEVKEEMGNRFTVEGYTPTYMLVYLGQKKVPQTSYDDLRRDVEESKLSGCPLSFLADYRDSFEYLHRTLHVLKEMKSGTLSEKPNIFIERLRLPLENRKARYRGLSDVLKLVSKINRLQKCQERFNPDKVEGGRTPILKHLEGLSLQGFSRGELKEIYLIVVGHTTMGRILSGKMNEKVLKAITDLARTYELESAFEMLRYCRLMTMAETAASKRESLNLAQLSELFELYASMVRVVTSKDLDWDQLLDEQISSVSDMHHKIIVKTLKMMNQFSFLDTWPELRSKGRMEKEALADYDEEKLGEIENVIRLADIVEQFEDRYLTEDPLQLPVFYRKFMDIEFHGTGHIFERMDSRAIFILLWVVVQVSRGNIVNFNPLLAEGTSDEMDTRVMKVEEEAKEINTRYLRIDILQEFSQRLWGKGISFILGTGFQFKVNKKDQALHMSYIDIEEHIEKLISLKERISGKGISEIPADDLEEIEILFYNLDGFYKGHLDLLEQEDSGLKLPGRQKAWFEKISDLREELKSHFISILIRPEKVYDDLNHLYTYAPSVLWFVVPEFMALQDLDVVNMIEPDSPLIKHIFTSMKKIQALLVKDREGFLDTEMMHSLAQREFGPMVAGTVGLSEAQTSLLENMVGKIAQNGPLFDAFIRAFIFRDIGLIHALREKHKDMVHPVDHAAAGALLVEKEKIPARYHMGAAAGKYLILLVRYHDLLLHILKGEFTIFSLKDVLELGDKDLFDALFVSAFIMFISLREDLILEDRAAIFFELRDRCHHIMEGKTTLEDWRSEVYGRRGHLYDALQSYQHNGLQENTRAARFIDSFPWDEGKVGNYVRGGRMIYAMERLFRLRGIGYVEFVDLANHMVKVPLKFIYKKHNYVGIGYATFEKELFEALRIYNGLQKLPDNIRQFLLKSLARDEVRIFGYNNVAAYLNYENQIKLLLVGLLGSRRFKKDGTVININYLALAAQIGKRYEAVNHALSGISVEKLWGERYLMNHLFKAKTGLVLKKEDVMDVLTIDFIDRINVTKKIAHMETITDVDQLKNYYHYSLQSLRKNAFYTEDYELQLEKAFDLGLQKITNQMLNQVKRQLSQLKDFREIHRLMDDYTDRALDIGFTDEQKHRLTDLADLRKDSLKREKLEEIALFLGTLNDRDELRDYWNIIKWYLLDNRQYLGKEFENLVARQFDESERNLP